MKISNDQLKKIIREEAEKEMSEALPFMSQGVSDVVTGNFIYDGLQVIGALLVTLLGAGVVKGIQIKNDLERKAAEKVIEQRKADAAARVVELVEKYKDNAELMDLLKAKKMKLFSQKLSELEKGSSGRGIGPNLGSDVYKASKKKHGIQQ